MAEEKKEVEVTNVESHKPFDSFTDMFLRQINEPLKEDHSYEPVKMGADLRAYQFQVGEVQKTLTDLGNRKAEAERDDNLSSKGRNIKLAEIQQEKIQTLEDLSPAKIKKYRAVLDEEFRRSLKINRKYYEVYNCDDTAKANFVFAAEIKRMRLGSELEPGRWSRWLKIYEDSVRNNDELAQLVIEDRLDILQDYHVKGVSKNDELSKFRLLKRIAENSSARVAKTRPELIEHINLCDEIERSVGPLSQYRWKDLNDHRA